MSVRAGAAALCVAVALVGCSADAEPEPLPPLPSASASSPAALPIPSAALAETPEGAAAFTRFFFDQVVNRAYETLDPSPVDALSTSSCNSCTNIVEDVQRLAQGELRVAGERFKLAFAEAPPANPDGSIFVDFRFSSDPYVERDAGGEVVREEPAQIDQDVQVKLVRRGNSWSVDAIRTVDS